jgi:hypothetical protein
LSDGYYTITDRSQEERDYRNDPHARFGQEPNYRERGLSYCLVCGWPVEDAKHFNHVYTFDRGTTDIHVHRARPRRG